MAFGDPHFVLYRKGKPVYETCSRPGPQMYLHNNVITVNATNTPIGSGEATVITEVRSCVLDTNNFYMI